MVKFLLILILCLHSIASFSSEIIDGLEARSNDFIPVVQLDFYYSNKFSNCAGSFISPETILTAAHCVVDFLEAQKSDKYAELILPSGFEIRGIFIPHAFKNLDREAKRGKSDVSLLKIPHDLALIVLNKSWINDFYSYSTTPKTGEAMMAGFGGKKLLTVHQLNQGNDPTAGVKRFGRISISKIRSDGMMETTEVAYKSSSFRWANASRGDSGGPVIQNKRVIGVISGIDRTQQNQNEIFKLKTYLAGLHSPSFEEIRKKAIENGSTIP